MRAASIKWGGALLAALLVSITPLRATAQNYPDKPIRLIVTHAAGGALDASARQLAERLSAKFGQQMIVENRVGAAGMVATGFVAKAPADGYTLLYSPASFSVLPLMYPNMPFQLAEVTGVSNVVQAPFVLCVLPNAPFRNLADFVAQAKAQPGKLTWGSGGNGSFGHLMGAWFNAEAAVNLTHVPYKGEAPAVQAIFSGDVSVVPVNIATAAALIKAGKLRALAVSGARRSPLLPDVPTVSEQGIPVVVAPWFAMLAPAGMPKAIFAKLNEAVNQALQEKELRERFLAAGFEIGGGSEAVLNGMIEKERAQWTKIVKERSVAFD